MRLHDVRTLVAVTLGLDGRIRVVDHARILDRPTEPTAALTVLRVLRAQSLCGDGRGYDLTVDVLPGVEDPAQADQILDELCDHVLDILEDAQDDGLLWRSAEWVQLRDLGRAVRITITATP